MSTLGFILFMLGACGMDSSSRVIPVVMVAAGMALLWMGRKERDGRNA